MLSRFKSMVAHYTSSREHGSDDYTQHHHSNHHNHNHHRGREVMRLQQRQHQEAYVNMPAGLPNKEIPITSASSPTLPTSTTTTTSSTAATVPRFSTPDRTHRLEDGSSNGSASAMSTPRPAASTPSSFSQSQTHFAPSSAPTTPVPFPTISTPSTPNPASGFHTGSGSGSGSGNSGSGPSSPTIPGDFRTEIRYIETHRTQPSSPPLSSPIPASLSSSSSPDNKRPSRRYLTEKVQALKDDKAALTTLLQGSQKKLGELVSRNEGLTRTNQQLKAERERWTAERTEMQERERSREKELRALEETVRRQEADLRRAQERTRRLEEKNGNLERLLGERTADLKGAQVFLTTADSYSGADILKMVEDLNGEIFQLSASVAELLDNKAMMMASVDESARAMATFNKEYQGTLVTRIGADLVGYLVTKRSQVRFDPLPLQLAFQAFLAWWSVYMTERFCGGETGRDLVKIYQRIRTSEPQAVSGRWRAITSDKLKGWNTETHSDFMTEAILTLLGVCGWSRTGREAQSTILSIQAGVTSIAKLWTNLKSAMKEGVTTVDMQIFTYDPGEVFDTKLMEDAYGETPPGVKSVVERRSEGALARANREKERERILCTIGVGLRRSVARRTDNECYDQVDVSLKPKVALVSVLTVANSADRSDAMSVT